jgi:hypothetical protein
LKKSGQKMRAKGAATKDKGKPAPVAEPETESADEFPFGCFVRSLDPTMQEVLGAHLGVVMGKSSAKPEAPKPFGKPSFVYDVRTLHRTLPCTSRLLKRVEVEQSAFPLGDLPPPVLALVQYWVPLGDAAIQACVSRKFAAAFRDNVTWKRRCAETLKNVDIETVFAAEKETSWMAFYRRHAVYRIRVVTVFGHRGGTSLSGNFEMQCDPRTTVEAFLLKVASHPENRQRGLPQLRPHDPSRLGRRGQYGIVSQNPDAKANCEFRQGDMSVTIAEAGLVDGAVLEQQERMMCD